jgi:hypothetical protein
MPREIVPAAARTHVLVWLCVAWAASAAYILPFVDRGWIPHDEGLLGQSARRVLAGQLPHRDFDEVYTGGLSYLHAFAFKVGGVRLITLRVVLAVFVLAWVPAVYWIASRFARPPTAALATFGVLVWSVPNYFAGLPSWYILFFATFGVAALIRFVETGRRRWLVAAGLAGGLAFLIKLTAVYYVAGALLFLLARERMDDGAGSSASPARLVAKSALAAAVAAGIVLLISSQASPSTFFHFVVPIVAVCGALVWMEASHPGGGWLSLSRRMIGTAGPFVLSAAVPVVLFLVPYAVSGSLGDWWQGVFVTPRRRLAVAVYGLPEGWTVLPALLYAGVLTAAAIDSGRRTRQAVVAFSTAAVVAAAACFWPPAYVTFWNLSRNLNIAGVAGAAALVMKACAGTWPPDRSLQALLALAAATALLSLSEFPFAAPIYFCYTAPLVGLTWLGTVTRLHSRQSRAHGAFGLALAGFAAVAMNPGYVFALGHQREPLHVVPTRLARVGLRIPESDDRQYSALVRLIHAHTEGPYLYAGPDCPEVYFLSGLANPTRTLYEAFDREPLTPDRLAELLDRLGIHAVVINTAPEFSGPFREGIERMLAERFPESGAAGKFVVRWRR